MRSSDVAVQFMKEKYAERGGTRQLPPYDDDPNTLEPSDVPGAEGQLSPPIQLDSTLCSRLDSATLGDLEQQLELNLQHIINCYASYVRCICTSIKQKGIATHDLCSYLMNLRAFKSGHCKQKHVLLSGIRNELEKAETIDHIFMILSDKCTSFLNFEIFQSMVDEYDIDKSQEKLNYPQYLREYVNKHKLSEFASINPLLEKLDDGSKEVKLKMDIDYSCSLAKLDDLRKPIANILGIKTSTLRIVDVKEGCVLVTLLIPAPVADAIFISDEIFSAKDMCNFQALSVISLECNGYKYIFKDDNMKYPDVVDGSPEAHASLTQYLDSPKKSLPSDSELVAHFPPASITVAEEHFIIAGESKDVPIQSPQAQVHHIFQWDGGGGEIQLVGSFSIPGFSPWQPIPVTNRNSAGGVYVDLELPVGCHQYMFRVDGQWRLDPSNILPVVDGRNQVILSNFQLGDAGLPQPQGQGASFSMGYEPCSCDSDEENSESDTGYLSSSVIDRIELLSQDLSDTESASTDSSTNGDEIIKVIVHFRPKLPDISDKVLMSHFKEFNHDISHAIVAKNQQTKQSLGFGIVFFTSAEVAEQAMQRMRGTKIQGKYELISLGIQGISPDYSLIAGASAAGMTAYRPPLASPLSNPQPQAPFCTVIIKNLNPLVGESEVRSVINVSMLSFIRYPSPSNDVVIKFSYASDAQMAVDALNGRKFMEQVVHAFIQPEPTPAPPAYQRSQSNPTFLTSSEMLSHPSAIPGAQYWYQGQPHPPGPHGQPHPPEPHGQPHPPGPQGHIHGQHTGHFGMQYQPHSHQQLHPQGAPSQPCPQRYFAPPGLPYFPGPPAKPLPPGVQVSPEFLCSPVKLLPSISVKVTHLPPGITKEKLCEHFKMAGEIKGMPIIHHTAKTTYAHIYFVEPSAAKFAAEHLNGSSIDGVSLTVKLQPKKKPPKAKQVLTEERKIDLNNFEKVMKLKESQWNSLMHVKGGTTQFKEIMAPFKSNRNVVVTPLLEESCVKFTGKQDAVKDAFSFLKRNLSKEITIDSKPKREALVHLRPTLPDDLRQKYGVTIPDYQSANPTITFDKPNEKAYEEVKALVSCLLLIEVPLSGEYGLNRLEQVRAEVPAGVYICASESVPRKSVILCAFDLTLLNSITPRVQKLFAVSTVQCDCKPEEGVFLKLFNRAFVDNLPAQVIFNEEGRMTLAGGDDAIQVSMAIIRELLQGLYSRKFTFMCSPRFLPRIEQVVIAYGMEESSFKYYTQKGGGGGRFKRRGSQAKSEGSEEFAVYIFCRNEQVFQRASKLLGSFKLSASVPAGLSAYKQLSASPVSHPQSQASCTVVVKNLDSLVGESEIRSVINVSMLSFIRYPSPSNDVVIKFSYASDAQMAVDALNGRKFMEQVVHAFIQPEPTPAAPAYQRSQSNPTFLTSPVLPSHPPANPGAQYGYQGQPHPPGPQYHICRQHPGHFSMKGQQLHPQGPPQQLYSQKHFVPPHAFRLPGPHPPGQPLPPGPPGPYPPGPPAQPHPPGSPTKPETPTSPEKLLPSSSVKVTHLPPGITKEMLWKHFKMAGEIKGMSTIHHTAKTTYVHVNFVNPSAAKFAAEYLNGSSINGVSLMVKLQPKKKPPKSKQVPTKEKEVDPNIFEKVMKLQLEESQWNSLMHVKGGTTQFKEIMAPFKSNPNVMVTPLLEESCVKFTGKQDTVEDAFSFLKRSLSKEITIDSKPKREALVYLRPTLPDDLRQKYGVTIPDYQSANPTITFDKPNEKAYDEVKALVSSLQLIEVPLSGDYGLDRLEQVRAEVPAAVYICAPESVPRKSVFLCAFDLALFNSITPRVQQLFAVNTVQCDCKPEEGVFLKLFNRAFVDNLPAQVIFNEEGRMTLAGGDDAIQVSMARIRELLQGLYSRKFTFMCSPRFLPRIEQVVIPYGMEESSFKYYTQKVGGGGGRKRRGSQAKSGGSEEFAVYIFCRNEQVFQRASELLGRFKPSSRTFHFNHKGVDEVIKSMKSQLEKDYFVEVLDKGPGSLLINGLDPDEIQKCHDMIKEKVETTLIVTKYEPVNLQLFALLKLYGPDLEVIRRDCQELTILPPNKEHKGSCLIRIKGTIAQVEDVKSRLSSGLLSMNVASTTIDLLCPQGLFGMWCKRWNQVKEQEAKRTKVNIEFSKSADAADAKSLNVHFEVVGTDNTVVQEIAGAILAEGTETEEKTFSLSADGCGCLLKAKRDKKLDFLNNIIVCVGNINKQANTVTLHAPKELSDNLDTAEEQVRRFVGERANTSHVISSSDPVVGLILSSPTRSQQYIATANALAKDHKVSVHILKKPSIGLRITGTEASIASVKMLSNATVIEAIERTIMEKRVSVKPQYSSFLSSPDFSRFLSKLESDFSVICSYPRAGKTSELVASSLIHMQDQGHYVKVDICRGSVVHELVDAIVNAANEDLKHIGGLAEAILDAGGPAIQTESDDHVRMNGKVRPGSAVCLSAGNLPCKRIVHAVGPRWNGGQRGEEQTLYFTIFHSLEAANKESLSSIAFPAIGTGVFNVPLDLCARASLKAVRDFCMANPNTTIQNIKFVLFQQDAVDAFKPLLVSGICGEYQYGSASRPHAKHIAPDESLAVFSPISTTSAQSSDWQWFNDKGRFVSYGPDISSKLSSAYRANPKGSANVLINGVTYDINFAHMIQTNPITGHRRPIQHATATSSDVEWQYQNDVRSYTPYTAADLASIENMYQAKRPEHLFINGKAYTFDFTQMCQINVTTGFKRHIHRQTHTQSSAGASVAAAAAPRPLDEEDEPESKSEDIVLTLRGPYDSLEAAETKVRSKLDSAWKKQKIDKLPKNMTEDLEKKIAHIAKRNDVICVFEKSKRGKTSQKVLNLEGISFKVQAAASAIQEEILTFHLSTSQDEVKYPDEWQPQQKTMQLFPVLQGSPEWQHVEGKFSSTMGVGRVQNITRVQNKWVWEKYATQKKRLDCKNSGRVNEMELFHGTRNNAPKVIYDGEEGFDMRYGRQGMWGVANYFAVNASYSHSYAFTSGNGRQMFLVKVLTGDSCNCNPDGSLRMPPTKTAAQGGDVQFEQMRYDTVTGHTNGSQVYMTYDNDKAYPAYLITYI